MKKIELVSILVDAFGDITAYYNTGDLYEGQTIEVFIDKDFKLYDAHLAG
jgi:hypothetical protein